MKTSEWLSLAKEDVISATTEVKYLFEFLNQNLEDGYINNPVSIEETSKYFKDYAYKKQSSAFYMLSDHDALNLLKEYLKFERKSISIKEISFEDLML